MTSSVPDEVHTAWLCAYQMEIEPRTTLRSAPTNVADCPYMRSFHNEYVLTPAETNEQIAARFDHHMAETLANPVEYVDADIPLSLAGAAW